MKNSFSILLFFLLSNPLLSNNDQVNQSASLRINVVHAYKRKVIPSAIKISISLIYNNSQTFEINESAEGVFEKRLSPGSYRIKITGSKWNDVAYSNICLKPNEDLELTFKLWPDNSLFGKDVGGAINGRLLSPLGKPLEDIDIGIFTFERGPFGIGGYRLTHLFEDYVIDNLGGGYFRVWLPCPKMWGKDARFYLEAKSPGLAVQNIGNFVLRDGDMIDLGEVELLQKESILSGQVIDEDNGLPLQEVLIYTKCANMFGDGFCETDENGFYTITNLPPGTHSLRTDRWTKRTEYPYETDIFIGPGEQKNLQPIELQKINNDCSIGWIQLSDALLWPFSMLFILHPDGILIIPFYLNISRYIQHGRV